MKALCLIPFCILASACQSTNGFETYYSDYGVNPDDLASPGNEVSTVEVFDIQSRVEDYQKRGYVVLGVSNFQGEWAARSKAVDHATQVGADIVIVRAEYTGSRENHFTISLPTTDTTYHSGTVSTPYGSTTYSGTSTTYSSENLSGSYDVSQFDQQAVFMAKAAE
ncbi:hypothetical protein RM531_15820 [Salinisphaera sp. P385]|uniref:Lipoprotein n=1 Tax=Spectribacter acetivorans TaxID=3075603 RepID=A0ABU3BE20_9GAMM|nr:hypothetical protein [Salinisphaera sp. P385]MDT0619936.1 hypothetical protein [Salinisphaera sp. P385]